LSSCHLSASLGPQARARPGPLQELPHEGQRVISPNASPS
jgi:hypothetical protein